jgi:hypothetical protein
MSCRKGWSREIMWRNFSSKFVTKTYKARREELLLEREKSLMPATQPYVEIEKRIRVLGTEAAKVEFEMNKSREKYRELRDLSAAVLAAEHGLHTEFEGTILRHKLAYEQHKVTVTLDVDLKHIEWTRNALIEHLHGGSVETERRRFVRACPNNTCRGFLSTAWKCGMCELWACPECHELKGPEKDAPHTCDPGNVATAQLLAKDSRGCPKCASAIFKINGCDQMYCTQCHTAFSWRTGKVESGMIHNPHYYEYQRTQGTVPRNPGDVPCGGFPDWDQVRRAVGSRMSLTVPSVLPGGPRVNLSAPSVPSWIADAHRSYTHLRYAVIPRYTVDARQDNRDLRMKLMLQDFTEEEFKRKIQQREKAASRKTEIRQVLEMYTTVLVDLFQKFMETKDVAALEHSIFGLKDHTQATLKTVSTWYQNCAVPSL